MVIPMNRTELSISKLYEEEMQKREGTPFKHRIAEIHATSLKRLSKIEAADDPTDAAGDE